MTFSWLLYAATAAPSLASQSDWVQRHYGPADGLPVSSASSARMDADGFLWIATHDGLARFDGVRFDVHDSMRFPAMSGNRVRSLHTDAAQRVYALTEHGDWLSVRSSAIERAPMGEAGPQAVQHVDPDSLCLTTAHALHCPDEHGTFPLHLRFPEGTSPAMGVPTKDDTAWLIETNGNLLRYSDNAWQQRGSLPDTSASRIPRAVHADMEGNVWVAGHEQLSRWDVGETNSLAPHLTFAITAFQLQQDARQQIWIGANDALYRVDGNTPQQRFVLEPAPPATHYLSWHAPDGALWVLGGHRLWRFADADQALDMNQPPVLISQGYVLDLFFQPDGSVWAMTLRDGIYRLSRPRVSLLGQDNNLGGGNVYGVTQDTNGTLWMGTLGDGLKGLKADGTTLALGRDSGLPGDNPWLVMATPEGGLYVGTYMPGLWHRAPGASTFLPVALPDALIGEQTLSLSFDAQQRLWLGSSAGAWMQDRGLWHKQWPGEQQRQRINAMAHGDTGQRWLGGEKGVWRNAGGTYLPVAETLLRNTSVRDLYHSTDGALWISTDGRGLIRVAPDDPDGLHAMQLGRAQGLPSNSPHAVREDSQGHLWVNSNQGIFRLSRSNLADFFSDRTQRLSPLMLGLADGLTELEGNGGVQPSAAVDHLGRLLFPSQRGVVRIDPLAITLREDPPRVVFDSLESGGQTLALSDNIAVPMGLRNLLIRYGAADLHAGSELRFRHRLMPLETTWSESGNGRNASFTSLPPGHYRFEVLAGNSDGIWASTPSTLAFTIPHRWYETPVFRFALLLAGGLMLLTALRLRLRHLKRRAAALDHLVHLRTDELQTEKARVETALSDLSQAHADLEKTHAQIEDRNQQLASQAQRLEAMDRFRTRVLADVSHELRTPVMLVSLPLRELQAHASGLTETERRRLNLSLTQLDRLGGLVEQLVGLVQAESGQLRPRLRRIDLRALLDEIIAAYQPAAQRAGVTLALQADVQHLLLFADRNHLLTVFGNLIDNALKYTPANGSIHLRLGQQDEHVLIQVQDTGSGFSADVAEHLFERFYRVEGPPRQGREGLGIGLALARELVELHAGRISAHSAPEQGATFTIQLPLGSAHIALDDLALDATTSDSMASQPLTHHATSATRQGHLLLVEDHPDLAAYLTERLSEHLPTRCVASTEQALAHLADNNDIGLIVSDVVLPGLSGLALCQHVSSQDEAPGVILISAKAAESDRQAGLDAGAAAYLAKPFPFEALLQSIAAAWPAAAPRLTPPPAASEQHDPLLQIALNDLGNAEFSISGWAEQAHLSERQLRRRVSELTGQPPQTWLREQRLLRVRHLIRSGTCKTLADAGARCGLDNPAWLYRSYRARFGEH